MSYKQIHSHIWKDEWFMDLTPEQKLLFLYLFSNESANLIGIYKINLKVIVFETGLDSQTAQDALAIFQQAGKIVMQDGYIWIVNLTKYNTYNAPTVKTKMKRELDEIPNNALKARYQQHYIGYGYPIDSLSIASAEIHHNITEHNITEQNKAETEEAAAAAGVVFTTWQNEIGLLTKMTSEQVGELIDTYPQQWILDAIQEAVKNNARKFNYIAAILKSWKTNGRGTKKTELTAEQLATEVY